MLHDNSFLLLSSHSVCCNAASVALIHQVMTIIIEFTEASWYRPTASRNADCAIAKVTVLILKWECFDVCWSSFVGLCSLCLLATVPEVKVSEQTPSDELARKMRQYSGRSECILGFVMVKSWMRALITSVWLVGTLSLLFIRSTIFNCANE